MSRISPIDLVRLDAKAEQIFAATRAKFGFVPNLHRVLGISPASLQGYHALSNALEGGKLSAAIREQIALAVAEMNDCRYCLSAHTLLAHKAGLNDAAILGARRVQADDVKSNAALRLARAITLQRGHLIDSDLEAARTARITDEEIIEVVAHVALNILTNYVNNSAQTAIDFPVAGQTS